MARSPVTRLPRLAWNLGDVRRAVHDAERRIRKARLPCPEPANRFYEHLASEAEDHFGADAEDWARGHETEEQWEASRAAAAERLNLIVEGISDTLFLVTEMTESPIEAMFGAWAALFGNDGYNEVRFSFGPERQFDPEWGTIFTPQVEVGQYRPDFLFKTCLRGEFRLLAVECDGHDYHERTPEQAARDRSRDRAMHVGGIPVLRFTGREIVRDVAACVGDLNDALHRHAEALLVEAGIEKRRPQRWIEENVALNGPSPRRRLH